MNRVRQGLKALLIEECSTLAWPWGILALAFAANVGIWIALDDSAKASAQTFGVSALLVVWFVVYVELMGGQFPLVVGFGITRRAFAAAMALHACIHAVAYGVVLAILMRVESATGGWGVELEFFAAAGLRTGNSLLDVVAWASVLIAVAALAVFPAAVYGRWGTGALLVVGAATIGGWCHDVQPSPTSSRARRVSTRARWRR